MVSRVFPDESFDYGPDYQTSAADTEDIKNWLQIESSLQDNEHMKNLQPAAGKHVRYLNETDAKVVEGKLVPGTPNKAYWHAILTHKPPVSWVDKAGVYRWLAETRPGVSPRNTTMCKQARLWLLGARMKGHEVGWKDDAKIGYHKVHEDLFDALRIYGDKFEGFGVFPKPLKEMAVEAGVGWLFVHPKDRIIPQMWEKYARANDIQFKESKPMS
ncbi:hypothetical protein F4778DRAFT_725400 [Xylariomycetidae sp. FL2044]|nr:hypothetical protein F4778DRAFT_725400 [Xylariomycetidae sp. FL2044]